MSHRRTSGSFADFTDSLLDALRPGNVILKFVQLIIFGLITATPYLIFNLDQVTGKVQAAGATGFFMKALLYAKALMGATFTGMIIGFTTLFDTIIHVSTVFKEHMIGTIIFSAIVLLFGTLTVYQPTRLIFNILDMQKGRRHSRSLVIVTSLVLVVFVISPISYLLNDGETITSGLADKNKDNSTNQTVPENNQSNSSNEDKIINSLNMLTDGGG